MLKSFRRFVRGFGRNVSAIAALVAVFGALVPAGASAADKPAPTLRTILLDQLKSTHTSEEWFVPAALALADLTPEQANWSPGGESHSVAQLATHLVFWNQRVLDQFRGTPQKDFGGDNKETFTPVDATTWPATIAKLDEILKEMEQVIEAADEAKLAAMAPTVAHVSTHNAYHLGQILYVRKLHGMWNPEKGVK
jgi:uncharacterized damage-inducible protein DinB